MPSRQVAMERRKRKTPKKTCCGLYLLRSRSEVPGKRKKHKPSSHWGGGGADESLRRQQGCYSPPPHQHRHTRPQAAPEGLGPWTPHPPSLTQRGRPALLSSGAGPAATSPITLPGSPERPGAKDPSAPHPHSAGPWGAAIFSQGYAKTPPHTHTPWLLKGREQAAEGGGGFPVGASGSCSRSWKGLPACLASLGKAFQPPRHEQHSSMVGVEDPLRQAQPRRTTQAPCQGPEPHRAQ